MDTIFTRQNANIFPLKIFSYWIFPVVLSFFIIVYQTDKDVYFQLTSEDGIVEWLTFFSLFISSLISLVITAGIYRRDKKLHPFFLIFSIFNFIAGFEEISWGQRLFELESSEFFNTYSDQKEINLHNTFQGVVGIKTKHIALVALFIFGVVLPWRNAKRKLDWKIIKQQLLVIPPTFLIPAFLIATVLMLDFPTGNEEEIGEFFYSVIFLLICIYNYQLYRSGNLKFEKVIKK